MSANRKSIALLPAIAVLIAMFALGTPARAQISFSLLTPSLAGNTGDILHYSGTLTNLGTAEVFLNGDDFNLAGNGLTVNDNPFFTNFPLSLGAGQAFTAEMFTVTIGSTTPRGFYLGTFTIQGGPTDTDFNTLATQTFGVSVGAPEPGAGFLMLVGGAVCLGVVLHRRKRPASEASLPQP